jgi:hypothetical protein
MMLRILRFAITKIIDLLLFKEIISFYSENNTKPINTHSGKRAELLNVKAAGIYLYRYALHRRQNYIWLVKLFTVECSILVTIITRFTCVTPVFIYLIIDCT